jgi:hypothetical protein
VPHISATPKGEAVGRTGLVVLNTVLIALIVGAAAGFAGWQLGSNHEAAAWRNRLAASTIDDGTVVRASEADTIVDLDRMTCQAITSDVVAISAKVATAPAQIVSIYQPVTMTNRAHDFATGKLAVPAGHNDVEVLRCAAQALFEDTLTYPIEYWATVDVKNMVFLAYNVTGEPIAAGTSSSPKTSTQRRTPPASAVQDHAVQSDLRNMIATIEQCYADAGKYPKSTTSTKPETTFACGGSTVTAHLSVSDVPGEKLTYSSRGAAYTLRITAPGGIAWHYDSATGGSITRG